MLARSDSGELYVVATACGDDLSAVEMGSGEDMDVRDAEVRLLAPADTSGWFEFAMANPADNGFQIAEGSTAVPADLDAPFFVRLKFAGGYGASQVFEHLPDSGYALVEPEDSDKAEQREVPLAELPETLSGCPSGTRTFDPAGG